MDTIIKNIEHFLNIEGFFTEMGMLNYYIPEETSLDINVPAASISITDISLKKGFYDIQKEWTLASSDYGFTKFSWRVGTTEAIGEVSPLNYLKPNEGGIEPVQRGNFGRFWIKQGMIRLYLENTHPTANQSVRAHIEHLYIEEYQYKNILLPLFMAKRKAFEDRVKELL